MNKLFAYKHKGENCCGKVAFFMTNKPVPGRSLASDGIILLDGTLPRTMAAIRCGACGGEIHPNTKNVRPARINEVAALVIRAANQCNGAANDLEATKDNLAMCHELLTKVHPDDQSRMYKGSALEASVKYLIGEPDDAVQIAGADGKPLEKEACE